MEIRLKVWHGSINLEVWYHDQVALIHGRRQSYLGGYLTQLQHYFGIDNATSIWIETDDESRPLPWHVPIGTLFDTYGELLANHQWRLRLQTGTFPSSLLPLMYGTDHLRNLREYLFAQLKQACMVVTGSTKGIMQLSNQHLDQLWRAMVVGDWGDYWPLINAIMTPITHKIPVKVYRGAQVSLVVVDGRQLWGDVAGEGALVQGITLGVTVTMAQAWFEFRGLDNFLHVVDHHQPLKLLTPDPIDLSCVD